MISTDFSRRWSKSPAGAELGRSNVECRVMDAERIETDGDAVDAVLCQMG